MQELMLLGWPPLGNAWSRQSRPIALLVLLLLLLALGGCANDKYYSAVTAQNERILKQHNDAVARQEREDAARHERLAKLDQAMIEAAGRTRDTTDDILVPLIIAQRETFSTLVGAQKPVAPPPLLAIEPPEKISDVIKSSTPLVLGAGGIVAGVWQNENMKEIALGGIAGAGVHNYANGKGSSITSDSGNTGSKNTAGGNQKISANGGSSGSAPASDPDATANATFTACAAKGGTMGAVASCMALAGEDVEIRGGQMYLDGQLYTAGNEYTGYAHGSGG